MTKEKKKQLEKTYKAFMDVMLMKVSTDRLDELAIDDIMGYGTTSDEKVFHLNGLRDIVNKQLEQSVDMNFDFKVTPVHRKIAKDGNSAVYVDELEISFQVDNEKNEFTARISLVFDYIEGQWKVIHWHGSKAEESEDDTWHKEEWKQLNERLQKQVEEKTADLELKNKELEIETALERVRSRSMAMHKSEELADLSFELVKQVQAIGVPTWFCAFNIYDDDEKGSLEWGSNAQGTYEEYRTPREGIFLRYYEAGRKGETLLVNEIGKKECAAHYDYLCSLPGVGEQLLNMKDAGIPFPTSQIDHAAYFKYGYILFITFEPAPEAHEIFKRFAKVFEQSYTRFLDLKKAEAQAREAQIEAALERIRSKSLAMYKTDDLGDVVSVLFEQMQGLSVDMGFASVSIFIFETGSRNFYQWIQLPDGVASLHVPYFEHPISSELFDAKESGADYFSKIYTVEEKNSWVEKGFELTDYKNLPNEFKTSLLEAPGYAISITLAKNSGICIPSFVGNLPSAEDVEIMKRVGKVFEQTYTRFLDLQKAEAQAREAQIEAALEKVRSRSLAMHSANELGEVVTVIVEKLKDLNVVLDANGVVLCTYFDDSKDVMHWIASPDFTFAGSYLLPYFDHPIFNDAWQSKESGDEYFSKAFTVEEKNSFFTYAFEHSDYKHFPDDFKQWVFQNDQHILSFAWQKKSAILIPSHTGVVPSEDDIIILKRFAKVFEQAYVRFMDLQKADAQAREAQIEMALEKVRSRSMGMQESKELKDVIQVVYDQFLQLKVFVEHAGFIMDYKARDDMNIWLADKNGAPSQVTTPFFDSVYWNRYNEAKEKGKDFFAVNLSIEEKNNHYQELFKHIPELTEEAKDFYFNCPGLAISTVLLDNVCLYVENFKGEPFTEEENEILMRFGKVFQQTYTRFLDLKNAEAQAHEAQIETSLEKVRSRTMAMQKSEDLQQVVVLLYKELMTLGVTNFATCGYVEVNEKTSRQSTWVTSPGGDSLGLFYLPLTGDVYFDKRYATWKQQQIVFHQTVAGENRRKHLEYAITTFQSKEAEEMVLNQFPDPCIFYCFNFSHGYLHLVTGSELNKKEESLLARFTRVFEQTYARFLDLKNAEAQAREAQIEAALERVRSQSMGMQASEDLSKVTTAMFEQLRMLGGELYATGIVLCDKHKDHVEQWHSLPGAGMLTPFIVPVDLDRVHQYRYDQWKKGIELFSIEIEEDFIEQHFKTLFELPSVKTVLEDFEAKGISMPTPAWEIDYGASFKYGYLLVSALQPFKEKHILPRFAKAFEQTYTRFLDLQKAEEQAKEAQIELSLERIRAQVTAMKESTDLLDIVVTMRTEFVSLGHEAHYFWYMRWLPEKYEKAMTSGDGTKIGMIMTLPRHIHGDIKHVADWEKSDEPNVVLAMDVETAVDYIHKMITLGDFVQVDPSAPSLDDIRHFGGLTFIMARTHHGEIGFSLPGTVPNPPQESLDTLVRFAGVFDLAYRRFEDLKNAELRNRETQIELSLERSRNQSMLMKHSDELNKTSQVFHEQLELLGIESEFSYLWLPNESKKEHLFHATWHETTIGDKVFKNKEVTYPLDKTEPSIAACYTAWESGERVHINPVAPSEVKDYFATWDELLNGVKKFKPELFPDGIYYVDAYLKYGCFGIMIKRMITDEEKLILGRFAIEFERAYTRFLDLKKSEMQTREAKVETALERVRARALAMQQPEELKEVALVMRQEMGLLGVEELETSSIYINDENTHLAECWYAIKDVRKSKKKLVSDQFSLNLNDTWVGKEMLKFYNSDETQISIVMSGQPRIEWIQYCEEKSVPLRGYYGDVIPDRIYHLYKFSDGAIGAATPGDFSKENWNLLRRAASVFSLAYSRFKDLTHARYDLQLLKEEKKRAEDALTELKSTQTQLIHAEKMASLGELTAGIAHEIQNPLNFVNNFSDVSVDLIEEMDEEMTLGNTDEVKDIAGDLKQNLGKIHHHGKRASFIVQGMLEHSRTNPGDKKPTDINILADEFLRLSYHGLRAKDKSFNAEIISEFDKDLPKISVIAQDFGRVLLNLVNNAFYAVAEKQKLQTEAYKPSVLLSTKKVGEVIEIRVKDNGNGIPDNVLKKIFQPFFTTKPTGEGTGLGLSMSYDIITKGHGGEIKVYSKEGDGTEFIIILPFQ